MNLERKHGVRLLSLALILAFLLGFITMETNLPTLAKAKYIQIIENQIRILDTRNNFNLMSPVFDTNKVFDKYSKYVTSYYNEPFPAPHDIKMNNRVIPRLVPGSVRSCAIKNRANFGLLLVNKNTYGSQIQWGFISRSVTNASALRFLVFAEGRCSGALEFELLQFSGGWLKITERQFPRFEGTGRAALWKDGKFFIISPQGEVSLTDVAGTRVTKWRVNTTILKKSKDDFHGGPKSILVSGNELFLSWASGNDKCGQLEVFKSPLNSGTQINFERIYKFPDCIRRNLGPSNEFFSELNGVGGRLIADAYSRIILSIGNAEIWTGAEPVEPNPNLGVIVSLAKSGNDEKIISRGHRNPQGLCIYKEDLYEVEQGPQGGDEFNLIQIGQNYGWPENGYGRPYGPTLNTIRSFGSHEIGRKPILTWMPSLAVSPMLCPANFLPKIFQNDFWVGTLKDQSIRRIGLEGNRVIYDEKIPLGRRIRDLFYVEDNPVIFAYTDDNSLLEISFLNR